MRVYFCPPASRRHRCSAESLSIFHPPLRFSFLPLLLPPSNKPLRPLWNAAVDRLAERQQETHRGSAQLRGSTLVGRENVSKAEFQGLERRLSQLGGLKVSSRLALSAKMPRPEVGFGEAREWGPLRVLLMGLFLELKFVSFSACLFSPCPILRVVSSTFSLSHLTLSFTA